MHGTAAEPKTTSEFVFDRLYRELLSLKLLPRSTISEAEIAERYGVSRQPVRDAFNRLGDLGLLTIRPQRPTVVCGFSMERIQNARFIRVTVELEVIKAACVCWDAKRAKKLEDNLVLQRSAIENGQLAEFHDLDYDYHRLICELSGHPLAFETIYRCRQHVDRLCVLSLFRNEEVAVVLEDHEEIARALRDQSARKATRNLRRHASRLDTAITEIRMAHSDYFD